MRHGLAALAALLIVNVASSQSSRWVSAYYAGWAKANAIPVDVPQIDFSCATHWIFFTLGPTSSGSFDGTGSGIDTTRLRQFANAVHAAGRKAIIGTGGSGADYTGVVTNPGTSITYLTNLMKTYGYDGVDVDWEPVPSGQYALFAAWVKTLKSAMLQIKPDAVLLVAAAGFDQAIVNTLQYFDQINVMTYDMAGPWHGWVSWHNSALYDGGNRFPSTGGPMPSIDAWINQYISAGVPASKLGFGIEFYGYVWDGITGPMQSGFGNVRNTVPYAEIMTTYGSLPLQWDAGAQAAYYSAPHQFVSFDADTTLAVKANYMRAKGLGGVIIYEVAAGYRGNLPDGYRDLLMQTMRYVFMRGKRPLRDDQPPSVLILEPKDDALLAGEGQLSAKVKDNSAVARVEFRIDGIPVASPVVSPPYSVSVNSWKFANGKHMVEVRAYDTFGNLGVAMHSTIIKNEGAMPELPDKIVYDDAIRPPFVNTSWGAVVDPGSHTVVRNGTSAIQVDYLAWGAFDIRSGSWGADSPVDPSDFDTLKADVYPATPAKLKVAFYNSYGVEVRLNGGEWNSIAIPLAFQGPFTRFYFQSEQNKPVTCYFDNVRFTAKRYRVAASK